MLAQAPEFSGKIAWDVRRHCPVQISKSPAGPAGPWNDSHTANATMFAQKHNIFVKPKAIETALLALASCNEVDPLGDYLNGLQWDGRERIGTWLADYCGAENNSLHSLIGSKFLIGAVARALRPGCRMDYMLVFEGSQGLKKSTAVKILGGEHTAENLPDMHGKDAMLSAGAAWFIEVGELAALRRSDIEQIKSYLTRTADTYRPPYGRHNITVPRWCVLVGNVNPNGNQYLIDTTGNRRFWPVPVGEIDTDALIRDRDQLWAEAVYCFNRGDPWWIENNAQRDLLANAQEEREQADEWENAIRGWADVQRLGSFTGLEIAIGALELKVGDVTVASQMRISICMKKLGYSKTRETILGVRHWRYAKPNVLP